MLRTLVSACRSAMMAMAAVVTCAACQAGPAPEAAAGLRHVAEIPLPGPSARFDYQSVDAPAGRLYVAHMNACEKGVVVPDFQDAEGRGSSRRFSARNLLEFAIALRLRELEIGVAFVGAVVHVLRAFERRVGKELRDFRLPDSLGVPGAPDLRVVIADGGRQYFTLATAGSPARLFGGIDLQDVTASHLDARVLDRDLSGKTASPKRSGSKGFGGPEGSRFLRLELSVTELARALDLDGA